MKAGGCVKFIDYIIERIRLKWRNRHNVSRAMKKITKAVIRDKEYAYSWHCNLAMAFIDEGCLNETAQRGAGRFMQILFGVDTYKIHLEYMNPPGMTARFMADARAVLEKEAAPIESKIPWTK